MSTKVYISLGLLSLSVIAYQLTLIQILSVVQWYHFAYMVISITLLGFGAAGSLLSVFKKKLLTNHKTYVPIFICISGLSMPVVISLSQLEFFRFDSYTLFVNYAELWKLALTYLFLFFPFFFSALAIGIIFIQFSSYINKIYFVNLLGSGLGGIIFLLIAFIYLPDQIPYFISVITIVSGIVLIEKKNWLISAIICAGLLKLILMYIPINLHYSEYKSLSKNLNLPDSKIVYKKNSPDGLIQITSSSLQRYAPGLSTAYSGEIPTCDFVYINGNFLAPVLRNDTTKILSHTTLALPFLLKQRKKVLMIDDVTGIYSTLAAKYKSEVITINSPLSELISLTKQDSNKIFYQSDNKSKLSFVNKDTRNFLTSDVNKYDLISLPIIGDFGGSPGLFAMQENYLLTKESFSEMWDHLTENGVISVTSWIDEPLRKPLKLFSILSGLLKEKSKNFNNHLIIIKSWGTITFIVSKKEFTQKDYLATKLFCSRMYFDPLHLEDFVKCNDSLHNIRPDDNLLGGLIKISSPENKTLFREYSFNIYPPTDNKPYFYQFIKLNKLNELAEVYGSGTIPVFETGYFLILLTFIQILIIAISLIILPLKSIGWKRGHRVFSLLYFCGIGVGYMFAEIVLIQKFIHIFGVAIYSIVFVISVMLISSGIGSLSSVHLIKNKRILLYINFIVVALLLLLASELTSILNWVGAETFFLKTVFSICLIFLPSFFMGTLFPAGIKLLSANESSIAWAWGINGFCSVVGAVSAVIISVEFGLSSLLFSSATFYLITLCGVIFCVKKAPFSLDN